jgi:hypothetical protein
VTPEILYTQRNPKPQPTSAPAKTPAPASDRVTLGWGQQGRLHLNRSKALENDRHQPQVSEIGRPVPLETPRIKVEQVDRYSRLERVRRPKPLWEALAEQKRDFRALEYLAVLKVGDCEYVIAEQETGEIFVSQTFETQQHCHNAAAELEQTFDMGQVLGAIRSYLK